ncbi:AI-2E family transporter [Candidatus Peregrinibacteria bacterium]|nr:AI-2E family transporter [Candidatus Peregrinibacteria bacterium]
MPPKKKKQSSLSHAIRGVRTRYVNFRLRVDDMKKQKENALLQHNVIPSEPKDRMFVDLNPMSVAKSAAMVLLMVALFYFLFEIRSLLVMLFVSFLFAAALDPLVDIMQKKGLPRSLSVIIIYLVAIVMSAWFVTNLVTLLAEQVFEIAKNISTIVTNITKGNMNLLPFADQLKPYFDQFYQTLDLQAAANQIQNALQLVGSQLLGISIGLINFVLVLVLTFFMTVEEKAIEEFVRSLFPSRYSRYISTRLEAVKDQVGYWLRGQVLVSVVCGVLTYIPLALLGINYALTLSVIAAIAMVIPVIGRVFAWLLAFPIVFNQSPTLSLWMTVVYFVLQQVELNFIIPYVMNRAVGLSPIILMIAMMIGGQYLGILGLILSIPVATTAAIFVKDYATRAK